MDLFLAITIIVIALHQFIKRVWPKGPCDNCPAEEGCTGYQCEVTDALEHNKPSVPCVLCTKPEKCRYMRKCARVKQ